MYKKDFHDNISSPLYLDNLYLMHHNTVNSTLYRKEIQKILSWNKNFNLKSITLTTLAYALKVRQSLNSYKTRCKF